MLRAGPIPCCAGPQRTLDELKRRRADLREADRALVDTLLARRDALPAISVECFRTGIEAFKIRHHGDFHLGQMLVVKEDVFIIDFEGEPRRASRSEGARRRPRAMLPA